MKPKILLSLPNVGGENYIKAFSENGFCVFGQYLAQRKDCDAIVLCGGGDVAPSYYGEKENGSNPPDIARDRAEMLLFESYYASKKPIIGICRGMQVINIAMGGDIYQDLLFADTHKYEGKDKIHEVQNLEGGFLYDLFGEKMTVNSAHHQACRKIAKGLNVIQVHKDKTVEAIWGENIIGLQWHPERMWKNDDFPDIKPLFAYFEKVMLGM